jgi:hypothetical protein
MPECVDEIDHSTLRAYCRDDVFLFASLLGVPQVAAGNDARRTVNGCVGVERGHDGRPERMPRPRGLNIAIVVMEILSFLPWVDHDGVECAEQVARIQEIVVQLQNPRDYGEFVKDTRFIEQRIDAIGVVSFEIVSSGHGVRTTEAVDFITRFSCFGGSEAPGQDYIAMFKNVLDVGAEGGAGW